MLLDLYIANQRADIPENFSVLYNYNSKDISNPTAVKNKFSSTITLYGTPNNTKLFGDIWKLDRILIPTDGTPGTYDTGRLLSGINFDPRKRVDFKIFNNSELIESGYLQLIEVKVGLSETTYKLQLYGGLGDFFYTLQYDEDDKEKSLESLYYGWKSTPEEELTAKLGTWDRNFVYNSWVNLVNQNPNPNTIDYDLTAIPTYSGKYEDFSCNKVLVNVSSIHSVYSEIDNVIPPSITDGGTTYGYYKSKYALVETPREISEYEARDLRSTQQRVGLRFSSFMDAISNPLNNGGYNVVLDQEIKETPYYNKTWILLDRPQFDKTSLESRYDLYGDISLPDGYAYTTNNFTASPYSTFDTTSYTSPSITYNASIDINFAMSSDFYVDHGKPTYYCGNTYEYIISGNRNKVIWDYVGLRLEIFDPQTNTIIDNSDPYLYCCSGPVVPSAMAYIPSMGHMRLDAYPYCSSYASQVIYNNFGGTNKLVVVKSWKKEIYESYHEPYIQHELYHSLLPVEIKWNNITKNSNFQIRLRIFKLRQSAEGNNLETSNPSGWTWNTEIGAFRQWYMVKDLNYALHNPSTALGYTNEIVAQTTTFKLNYAYIEDKAYDLSSPYGITKKTVFGNTKPPLKYLLDWAKLFDLRFRMNSFTKTVYIEKRNNYYEDEINNLEVDLSKGITINPTIAKYKSFIYGLPVAETYASTIYNRKTNNPYGQVKFNTGYEFNNETNDLFSESVYKGLIPYSQSSYYFSHRGTGDLPWCVLSPTYKVSLYKSGGGSDETKDFELSNSWPYISSSYSSIYNDPVPKLCCFSSDDTYVDGINSLVFFDGLYSNYGEYHISDNTPEMMELNNGPCYILSRDANEVSGIISQIPIFLNSLYSSEPSYYSESYNFEVPELEFNNSEVQYTPNAPVYNRYWKDYTEDLYNQNGKTITIYAFVKGKPEDMMRKFWFFQGAIWVINEIKNYNISDPDTPVQMTLVKVDNPTNYLTN